MKKWELDKSIRGIGPISQEDDQSYGMVIPVAFYEDGCEDKAEFIIQTINSLPVIISAAEKLIKEFEEIDAVLENLCPLPENVEVENSALIDMRAAIAFFKGE